MNSLRVFVDRKTVSLVAVLALLLSLALPIFASAAQITSRSVALSNSSKSATGVSYAFTFTADNADAGAVVVEFCSNTPLLGESCTAPTGFTSASATASGGATISGTSTANKVTVTKTIAATENTFTLGNITNPSSAGALYARIVTYVDATDAAGYTSANPDVVGAHIDDGSVAMSITDTIGVSGAVLESMTFCVAKKVTAITNNCGDAAANPPVLELGEDVGGVVALQAGTVSTGVLYTQLSTNAASGAVVSLKNSNTCGGLKRASPVTTCDIIAGDVDGAAAEFGVKTGTAAAGSGGSGVLEPFDGSGYNSSTYNLNWVAGNATGVGSTYGDPFLDTDDGPVNNMNMDLTFGATITNNTPAGKYSADLSLIATGKF